MAAGARATLLRQAALLIESGIHKKLDGLVVACARPNRLTQAPPRSRFSAKPKPAAIAAQLPVEEKPASATEKSTVSGSIGKLRRQSKLSPPNSAEVRWRGDPFRDFPYLLASVHQKGRQP